MPIPRIGIAGAPIDKPDYSGIENFIPNVLESMHAPQKLKEEREQAKRKKEAEELAHHFMKTYGPRRNEAEIGFLEGHSARELTGLTPQMQDLLKANGGVMTPELTDRINKYYEQGAGGKQYAPSYVSKMNNELDDAKAGYYPGSNRTKPIEDEVRQKEIIDGLELSIQKYNTDSVTRQRALNAYNIDKAFASTNLDDLTAYSGALNSAALASQTTLDALGLSSEKYKKYQEALTKSQLEAKEIRQYFGDSITPEINEQLKIMLNPTGFGTSPETAKRKVEAARHIIRKQLHTIRQGLQNKAAYTGGKPTENERAYANSNPNVAETPIVDRGKVTGTINGKKVLIPKDKVDAFIKDGGQVE